MKHTWHVSHDSDEDKELFTGSKAACLKYAKQVGGKNWGANGYHVGYWIS